MYKANKTNGGYQCQQKIHSSGEDYLEAILVLHKKLGIVRSVDVARHLELSKPSVSVAVNTLIEAGFLTKDSKHFLYLTDAGRDIAEKSTRDINFLQKNLSKLALIQSRQKQMPVRLSMLLVNRVLEN